MNELNEQVLDSEVIDAALGVVNQAEMDALNSCDRAELEAKDAARELAGKNEKLEEARAKVKSHRVAKIKEQIAAFGILQSDLFDPEKTTHKAKTARPPVKAKYRGPKGEEWSGRGFTPRWLRALIAKGHTKEELAVKADA